MALYSNDVNNTLQLNDTFWKVISLWFQRQNWSGGNNERFELFKHHSIDSRMKNIVSIKANSTMLNVKCNTSCGGHCCQYIYFTKSIYC